MSNPLVRVVLNLNALEVAQLQHLVDSAPDCAWNGGLIAKVCAALPAVEANYAGAVRERAAKYSAKISLLHPHMPVSVTRS